jgi:hypothetical protein
MMPNDWMLQLVDSSAIEQPNEVRQAIRDWLSEYGAIADRHIVWEDDSPYPSTITIAGTYRPSFSSLLEAIQPHLGATEYIVFALVGDAMTFDYPLQLHIVTKPLTAILGGPDMVHELVRQLHTAAETAMGSTD